MRDLPPLKALRAFEACYRLRSFTRAASALNVGQPAISHQIRLLERDLGVVLFKKRGSIIQSTEEADTLYSTISSAFFSIVEASRALRRTGSKKDVRLATYSGIAAYWITPRLARLREQVSDFSVRIVTADLDEDIMLGDVDCAILFGRGKWPGADAELLIPEEVVPIASPSVANELGPITPAELIERGPLIHLEDPRRRWHSWEDWRDYFAKEATEIDRAVTVTNHGLAIHQALTGQGVALAWTGVVTTLIEGGSVVALHDTPLVSDRGYWLVSRHGFLDTDRGKALRLALADAS